MTVSYGQIHKINKNTNRTETITKIKKEGIIPKSSYETSTTPIPKPGKTLKKQKQKLQFNILD